MHDLFQEAILDEARHPRNYGKLEVPDISLTQTNASCGDIIVVELKFDDEAKIVDLMWSGAGCTISQAAMSQVSQLVRDKTSPEVEALTQPEIEATLGLTQISPGRVKCLLLGLTAVQKAVRQYQRQHAQKK